MRKKFIKLGCLPEVLFAMFIYINGIMKCTHNLLAGINK